MAFRRFLTVIAALALALLGLAPSTMAPSAHAAAAWSVHAGAATPDSAVTGMAFYPAVITIDVGDSITWTAVGDAHTVAFLSGAPQPSPLDPAAGVPAGGSTYDGTGFVNSGILPPGQSYTLTFSKAGTFPYVCLFHPPGMIGTVVVQPAGTAYPLTQAQYSEAATVQSQRDLIAGINARNLANEGTSTNADGSTNYNVWSGVGAGMSSVMRFLPKTLTIHVGDTVTWTNHDLIDPHTVTFAPDGNYPEFPSPKAIAPAGGPTYDGTTFTNSGLILPAGRSAPGLPTTTSYTLKFTKAGVYTYHCLIHDKIGMIGKIRVVSAGASANPGSPLVSVGISLHLGPVLTDSQGMTLYFLTSEAAGQPIKCAGQCLTFWSPLAVASATTDAVEGPGLTGVLSVNTRPDGINQVSYGELPLYRFAGDKAPGDTNGQGISAFGGVWLAAQPTTLTRPLISPIVTAQPTGGNSASFVVSFISSKPGQGQVLFGSGPGCSGLVEVATQDLDAGTTTHTIQVRGNDMPGTVGDNGIQPGTTYWYKVVTVTSSGQEVDDNGGKCYSVAIPTA
jgi:plastocyanin